MGIWVIVCVQKPSQHILQTFRPLDQGSPNYGPRTKSGPRNDFMSNEKIIYLRTIYGFGRMQHIPKQSHYVRRPTLALLCNNLCGPRMKTFGDPALDYACLRLCSADRIGCIRHTNFCSVIELLHELTNSSC